MADAPDTAALEAERQRLADAIAAEQAAAKTQKPGAAGGNQALLAKLTRQLATVKMRLHAAQGR